MHKETVTSIKGLFSALIVLTLAAIVILPLMSGTINNTEAGSEVVIYIALLIVWIILGVTLGILYVASGGSQGGKPIRLPISRQVE